MALKAALLCVAACLVQQSLAGPYCLPKPPSCSSGKVIVKETEQISYKPIAVRPKSAGKVVVKEVEEIEKISYNPIAVRPSSYLSNSASVDVASYGGSLAISSIGPISPTGIAVATDLGLAGDLEVSGELPYLTAVAFEGQFATADTVPVAYGCGDYVGITEQIGGTAGSGSYVGNIGASSYGSSYLGCGCKC